MKMNELMFGDWVYINGKMTTRSVKKFSHE